MAKPFIQLFKTPRCQYVFDVNKNEMLPVSAESFDFLKQCMAGQADIGTASIEEIQELIREGYLRTESVVQEIRHPYTPYLKYFLDRKLAKITLQVTQGCNLRCKYCIYSEDINVHQRSHSNKRMNWEIAKRSVEFLLEHSVDSHKVNIGFYGGEPLLEFPLIKRTVKYAKELFDGKKISFALTTNGTLLTDEILAFFEEEDIHLVISLDGPKAIHDKSRVFPDGQGSFDTVIKNFERIKLCFPEYAKKVSFSMVMDPANDFDCINEIVIASEDMNRHTFHASIVDKSYDEAIVSSSEVYSWKYQYQQFLALLSIWGRYPSEKVSAISRGAIGMLLGDAKHLKLSGPLRSTDAPSGPCVPGQLRLFVDAEGKFFPCERVSENSGATCIGSLDSGFDICNAAKLLNVGDITKDVCRKCWSFRHCTVCVHKADNGGETLSADYKLTHCERIRNGTYTKLRQLILLDEVNTYYKSQIGRKEGVLS